MRKDIQQPEWLNEPDAAHLQQMATLVEESFIYTQPDDAQPCPDVEEEWQAFTRQHIRKEKHTWMRKWAVAASILLVSLVGYAAYEALTPSSPDAHQGAVDAQPHPESEIVLEEKSETATDFVYGNASLEQIVRELATYHQAEVRFEGDAAGIRLHTQLSKQWTLAECVAFLNKFEQVHLELKDNTVVVK